MRKNTNIYLSDTVGNLIVESFVLIIDELYSFSISYNVFIFICRIKRNNFKDNIFDVSYLDMGGYSIIID